MLPEKVWLATAVATVPAVLLDVASGMIQRRQVRLSGAEPGDGMGVFWRFLASIVLNFFVLAGLSFLYSYLWAGSGRAFLYGAVIWLLVSIPALLLSRTMDDSQQRIMVVRVLSLLFKAAALSISLSYFIG
jgi:hypothetical protein